jgi:hypothetical protein
MYLVTHENNTIEDRLSRLVFFKSIFLMQVITSIFIGDSNIVFITS